MSKNDRMTLIQSIASRASRVLDRLAAAHMSPDQARRILRRTCPRRHIA